MKRSGLSIKTLLFRKTAFHVLRNKSLMPKVSFMNTVYQVVNKLFSFKQTEYKPAKGAATFKLRLLFLLVSAILLHVRLLTV
jgi:hypothetical protein